jgi:hypothetical protein
MDALKNRKFTVAAVALALIAAQENRGYSAYLKQVGPVPLRFSPANAAPDSFTLPASLVERIAPTNKAETAVPEANSAQTNAVPTDSTANSTPAAQTSVPSAELLPKTTPTPPASEMLVVSPQMLTEYFKPGTEATNSAYSAPSVVAPVPVGFTPPLVTPPSRATYTSP